MRSWRDTGRLSDKEGDEAPDDGTCRTCYEWRRYPAGQEHFGFAWWRVCNPRECDHAHHRGELWMAT